MPGVGLEMCKLLREKKPDFAWMAKQWPRAKY